MEAIYRHNEKFKEKGNPNNSKHVSILQKNIGNLLNKIIIIRKRTRLSKIIFK